MFKSKILSHMMQFNEMVCMDLKEIVHGKTWLFHLIDSLAKYSVARVVDTKAQEVIVQHIFTMWICYFGRPGRFMSDNGGEFANSKCFGRNGRAARHCCYYTTSIFPI